MVLCVGLHMFYVNTFSYVPECSSVASEVPVNHFSGLEKCATQFVHMYIRE